MGVSREDVESDYMLTNDVIDFENFILPRLRLRYGENTPSLEDVKATAGVRREYVHAALDAMERRHGSIDGYFERAMGLNVAERRRLRDRYVIRV